MSFEMEHARAHQLARHVVTHSVSRHEDGHLVAEISINGSGQPHLVAVWEDIYSALGFRTQSTTLRGPVVANELPEGAKVAIAYHLLTNAAQESIMDARRSAGRRLAQVLRDDRRFLCRA